MTINKISWFGYLLILIVACIAVLASDCTTHFSNLPTVKPTKDVERISSSEDSDSYKLTVNGGMGGLTPDCISTRGNQIRIQAKGQWNVAMFGHVVGPKGTPRYSGYRQITGATTVAL